MILVNKTGGSAVSGKDGMGGGWILSPSDQIAADGKWNFVQDCHPDIVFTKFLNNLIFLQKFRKNTRFVPAEMPNIDRDRESVFTL